MSILIQEKWGPNRLDKVIRAGVAHLIMCALLMLPQSVCAEELQVFVCGAVKKPGFYCGVTKPEGRATARQAIELAGGPSDEADLRHVRITSFDSDLTVDLLKPISPKGSIANTLVDIGDTVFVPDQNHQASLTADCHWHDRIAVVGAVTNPGFITAVTEISVSEAIIEAGGFESEGIRSGDIRSSRFRSGASITEIIVYDLTTHKIVAEDHSPFWQFRQQPKILPGQVVLVTVERRASTGDFGPHLLRF